MLPFEAASLLLLATMIAVVLLAKRQRAEKPAPSVAPAQTAAGSVPAGATR
jgi:hypothetical protein